DTKFCNVTLVGTKSQGGIAGQAGRRGAMIRRGTGGKISNVIITDFTQSGINIDNNETMANVCDNSTTLHTDGAGGRPSMIFKNTILFDNGGPAPPPRATPCPAPAGPSAPLPGATPATSRRWAAD